MLKTTHTMICLFELTRVDEFACLTMFLFIQLFVYCNTFPKGTIFSHLEFFFEFLLLIKQKAKTTLFHKN